MSELYGKCPAEVDLCLPQGQTWDTSVVWEADGEPVNLTGWSTRMMLRASAEAASPTVSLSTATSTMTALSNGTIGLSYSAISSAAITAATYLYDLEVVNPSGNVRRLMQGRAVVSREMTR
jgi:meiotically up-regulated gene 157 (Mug157) protein